MLLSLAKQEERCSLVEWGRLALVSFDGWERSESVSRVKRRRKKEREGSGNGENTDETGPKGWQEWAQGHR